MPETAPRPPAPQVPDPRGWSLDHAKMARTATITARESLAGAPDLRTIATALCAIAEALTSIAWTEAHPPRRYPFRQAVVNGEPLDARTTASEVPE